MLILAARDAEDLEIISARLQDAIAKVKDLVWLPDRRRFAAVFNRFKWEDAVAGGHPLRVRAGLCFDFVQEAKSQNIRTENPEAVLALLSLRYRPHSPEESSGEVELVFSGGGTIKLKVECIETTLSDLSGEWTARRRPAHPLET